MNTENISKRPVSVIISAYKANDFIEECLDSIQEQTYFKDFDEYEILLGFDGCEITMSKVLSIKDKYKNLKLFWFEINNGPYLVFNTLISKSNYDTICIFGADDIMLPDNISYNINFFNNNFVKMKCSNFNHPNKDIIILTYNPDGLVIFNKKDFFDINGFEIWRCAADSDIVKRFIMNGLNVHIGEKSEILRRVHENSLTKVKEYGRDSQYRKDKSLILNNKKLSKIDKFQIYENVKII